MIAPRPVKVVLAKKSNTGSATTAPPPTTATPVVATEEEDVDVVKRKVLIMKKIRDKKLQLTQTFDPEEKKKLKKEMDALIQRLQSIDAPATTTPPTTTPVVVVPANNADEDEDVYTFTVKPGPIGLGLSAIDGNEASKGVTISKISAQSQAEQCEDLTVGDILVKIGNVDVRQKKLSDVMALLKTTKRPMVLTFKLGDDDDSDSD